MTDLLKYRQELIKGLEALDFDQIHKAADVIFGAWQRGNSVYIFGNGHSASTSETFAADLRKWPQTENNRGVKAHALTLLPLMTAYANDVSYEDIFKEQLHDLVENGDVVIGITCGGSKNVMIGLEHTSIQENYETILICGWLPYEWHWRNPSVEIWVLLTDIRQIEDAHSTICHMICGEVKARIVGEER